MQCKICGSVAKGYHYGVLTCMSCKVFFQRHVLNDIYTIEKIVLCRFSNGSCKINERTRKNCISCRLTACLKAGMCQRRQKSSKTKSILSLQNCQDNQLPTLDLLNADRSSLNSYQWNIISNITHKYDLLFEEHKITITQFHIQNEQKPVKLRLKLSNYTQIVTTYFTFMVAFLDHYLANATGYIPYFDKDYSSIVEILYGNETILKNEKLREQLDEIFHNNPILIKLILVIFAFENVTPALLFSNSHEDQLQSFFHMLHQSQNNYVDLLWRYMLYRFRHENIVIHLFSHIIYNCLRVQDFSYRTAEQNSKHNMMYETLIDQFESKCTMNN
ncbi:hypothetical protein I4U23_007844 [Adineta vaga]|nr:hypothetical protein I4U23_007844 [Adineta vaga]